MPESSYFPRGLERATRLLEQADEALAVGNFQHALMLTEQILPLARYIPEVWQVRAKALLALCRPLDALEAARQYATARPRDVSAQWELSQYAWRAGRLGLAQQAMEMAVKLSGEDPALFAEYAWFLAFERGPRLAEEIARKATALAPESSTAWAALGLAQLRLHRVKEAEESLGRALRLDPNDPCAQCAMLFLLSEERKNEKALALSHILQDAPGSDQIVESVRRDVTRRMIARKLVERGVQLGKPTGSLAWHRRIIWTAGILTAGWMAFICFNSPIWVLVSCVSLALLLTWLIARAFQD